VDDVRGLADAELNHGVAMIQACLMHGAQKAQEVLDGQPQDGAPAPSPAAARALLVLAHDLLHLSDIEAPTARIVGIPDPTAWPPQQLALVLLANVVLVDPTLADSMDEQLLDSAAWPLADIIARWCQHQWGRMASWAVGKLVR
jgi:hypothetical protein